MKLKTFIFLFAIIISSTKLHAQFHGGNGSGFAYTNASAEYFLFIGGNGDGYNDKSNSVLNPLFIGGTGDGFGEIKIIPVTDFFHGGNGDGFSGQSFNVPFSLFSGGNGDGFSAHISSVSLASFKTGNGDGFSVTSTVVPYALFIAGGNGDGFDAADNNFFTGGNGDGFSTMTTIINNKTFFGGNGDGANNIAVTPLYPLFKAGIGDGHDVINKSLLFIQLTSPINGSYCAGSPINVNFHIPVPFNNGNIFSLQLSDGFGNFASPVTIGTNEATGSGVINGIIPLTTTGSNQYKVRVTGNNPLTLSSASDSSFTVIAQQTFYADSDGDLYGTLSNTILACVSPPGFVSDSTDCNDVNALIHPGLADMPSNGIDDNCDGFIDNGDSVVLTLKVFIEGFYAGNDQLNPVIDPINQPALNDTITVALASPGSPYNIIYMVKGVLQINGSGVFVLPYDVLHDTYYLIVMHRNSLETWSKFPISFNAPYINVDMTEN